MYVCIYFRLFFYIVYIFFSSFRIASRQLLRGEATPALLKLLFAPSDFRAHRVIPLSSRVVCEGVIRVGEVILSKSYTEFVVDTSLIRSGETHFSFLRISTIRHVRFCTPSLPPPPPPPPFPVRLPSSVSGRGKCTKIRPLHLLRD